jgi:N utilization substance protein B
VGARTKARKRALDVLFSADLRQLSLPQALAAEAERAASEPAREASWLYAREIVDGVIDHQDEIDEQIETYAQGWTLARMPAVDRAILRIGVWELLFNDEVPEGVAISEAVEAATVLSTDDSAGFVNGLLAKIAQNGPHRA